MRFVIFAFALGLAGCASEQVQRLQTACEGGNLEACAAAEQLSQQKAAAVSQALSRSGAALQRADPAYGAQPRQPVTCIRQGVFLNCY